jgi:uncharacterized protein (TIGR00725 family)
MESSKIIGVMGGGQASPMVQETAYELGRRIAIEGWVLLNGGRSAGVMEASAKGATECGGLTIGILPDDSTAGASDHIKIPIVTGMGNARNIINVLSSHIVVACSGGTGTISEVALALKCGKPVILLGFDLGHIFDNYRNSGQLCTAETPDAVIQIIRKLWSREDMGIG